MPTPKPLPRTFDAWRQQLETLRLPVPAEQHEQLRRALRDSRRSLRELAELLQGCPGAALHLLREANRHVGSLGQPAESLEVALNRLGLQRSEELLNQLPALAETDIPKALRQLLQISQHAAQQASGLFGARLARLWQELHCTSLLFLAPLWPLAMTQPQLFEAWEQRVLVAGEPATKVEFELFGLPLLQLGLQLAEHWRLPEWIAHGYRLLLSDRRLLVKALQIAHDHEHPLQQQQRLDADPALRRWLTQPANTVLLANSLALSAHASWGGNHSLRWQRLSALYLQLPLGDIQQLVHQQAVTSARQPSSAAPWQPAEALLWPWTASHWQPLPAPAAAVTPAADLSDWRQACAELLCEPSPFLNVGQLTACARDALQHCGLPRVMLLLADRSHSRLRAQQSAGLAAEAKGLELEPNHSQVLRRLLAQPGQLRLSPANLAQYSALLPGALKALFPSEHLLLRSLASNGRVVMLVVADRLGQPLGDSQLQAFAKTVQCIERAVSSFARRAR
ncbi:HDOD domain-containing protein [Pseudomonas cavernae]|uniref:HDOD domain-containing protein n=1 Tax=Pseudomonas cavernae TaxID=2320867 RepID=A0A385YWB1_9PSED|nr:HDOD domain-containing protein [Pseudomonas cavernae]AYC31205.1 HDOD domain-containing protein [Pseudomonas cavernae]